MRPGLNSKHEGRHFGMDIVLGFKQIRTLIFLRGSTSLGVVGGNNCAILTRGLNSRISLRFIAETINLKSGRR